MPDHLTDSQMLAASVIFCLAIIAVIIVSECWRALRYPCRDAVQWFRNLPFMYGWRVQRWVLGRLGLTLCHKCGLWVDRDCHRLGRCPGEQRDQVESIDKMIDILRARTDKFKATDEKVSALVTRVEGDWKSADAALTRLNQLLLNERSDRNHLTGRVDAVSEGVVALDTRLSALDRNAADLASKVNLLDVGVKRLEEFAQMDLADIRTLKAKVNHIIPEVLT